MELSLKLCRAPELQQYGRRGRPDEAGRRIEKEATRSRRRERGDKERKERSESRRRIEKKKRSEGRGIYDEGIGYWRYSEQGDGLCSSYGATRYGQQQ